MIKIYTRTGLHILPDTLLSVIGQIVAQEVNSEPEIDETETTPVLEDVPEDPQVTIEALNARILHLEAELEEHKRATDSIIAALGPLGTVPCPAENPQDGGSQTVEDAAQGVIQGVAAGSSDNLIGVPGSTTIHWYDQARGQGASKTAFSPIRSCF